MNINYKEAIPNTDIPFEVFAAPALEQIPLIDAVYVPTQSHRPLLETEISVLKNNSKTLHFLFSENAAPWVKDVDHPNLYIHTNLESERRLSQFMHYSCAKNPSNAFKPNYDIPYKRNLSLLDASRNNYKTICLLDDDITLTDNDFRKARVALLSSVDIASFHVLDYPDVSTIDHIERIILERPSRVSIGGNCLFMNVDNVHSFFPDAYNDDWYFIFSHIGSRKIVSLGTAVQRPYTPWTDLERVGFEQFGDIVIEGAKNNIKNNRPPFFGDMSFWKEIKDQYIYRLKKLVRIATEKQEVPAEFVAAIKNGIKISETISASDFVVFLKNYQADARNQFMQEFQRKI